ncbi:uroporphyrinogen-III synthase [Candidatus Uabimicrobium sp. HlEnr_7]|uniref:uroporphyrinogen-III synthase n=1 Tax=Candidatus Uabimicrobium helgolandensis TaxID=3095367 RepID=UPI0035573D6E
MSYQIFYTGSKTPPKDQTIIWTPTIEITYTLPHNEKQLLEMLGTKCNCVFFSKHGVIGFQKYFPLLKHKVFAVGKSTKDLIESKWKILAQQPKEQNAEGMIRLFRKTLPYPTVVIQGNKGRKDFSDWLYEEQWNFIAISVYRTDCTVNKVLRAQWSNNENDYVFFTSPSTIQGFLKTVNSESLQNIKSKIISIGPTTSSAVKNSNGVVYYESPYPNITKLLLIKPFVKG